MTSYWEDTDMKIKCSISGKEEKVKRYNDGKTNILLFCDYCNGLIMPLREEKEEKNG